MTTQTDEVRLSTMEVLYNEAVSLLADSYELVYIDRDDKLTDEQVEWALARDFEALDESAWEFIADARFTSASTIVSDIAADVVRAWLSEADYDGNFEWVLEDWDCSAERYALIEQVEERDSSDPIRDLASKTGEVMTRTALDVEFAFDGEDFSAVEVIDALRLPLTDKNVAAADELISEAGYGYKVAFALATADVGDLYDLPYDAETLEIVDPHIFLTNPYAGDGHVVQFQGVITIDRKNLKTDKGAAGYGWEQIAGCYISAYRAEIRVPV